jgi:hypothetical protein
MKKLLEKYLKKFKDNELGLSEIRALKFAEEGSVEKEIFWELQEVAWQKKETNDFLNQMKYHKKLLKKNEIEDFLKQMERPL